MANERSLQKGIKWKEMVYIFGGDGS